MRLEPRRDESSHDATAVANGLTRVVWRIAATHVLIAATTTIMFAGVGMIAGYLWPAAIAGIVVAAIVLWRTRADRTMAAAARRLEAVAPECLNVVVTAEELLRHPDRAAAWITAQVTGDALSRLRLASPSEVVPLWRPLAIFALACFALVMVSTGFARRRSHEVVRTATEAARVLRTASPGALRVTATITPPSYAGQPARQVLDPDRLDVLEGSTIHLGISGGSAQWQVRLVSRPLPSSRAGAETVVETVAAASGYFVIEALDSVSGPDPGGTKPQPRLLPLTVIPDRAPVVRLEKPARDLVYPSAKATVPLTASASDDLGVRALEIRYTKVSGSGEQFEFEEGSLPVTVARGSNSAWTAEGAISLAAMKLEPGDSLVYRAVARDGRPGDAGLATSDTFFIEIAGPGQVALDGFALPPNQERYALSQQMIVLKIQRLRARERAMSREALTEAATSIAVEQRAVRSNFIFLMGGQVEDEEVEAEQAPEIQEGRLLNTARKEVNTAIAHMSRAEQALIAINTAAALEAAKAAVEALRRAFGRNRYILRTLPVRSRVDPFRRLTGELKDARDWRRDVDTPTIDRETRDARILLAKMLAVASEVRAGRAVAESAFTSLAEQALAIDPGATVWQDAAKRLDAARTRSAAGLDATAQLSEAIAPVIARAQRGARMAAQPGTRPPGLLGTWARESGR